VRRTFRLTSVVRPVYMLSRFLEGAMTILISVEGKLIRAREGERPWLNNYHNKWSVVGYEWLRHHNRWSMAPRTHMSAAFVDVVEAGR